LWIEIKPQGFPAEYYKQIGLTERPVEPILLPIEESDDEIDILDEGLSDDEGYCFDDSDSSSDSNSNDSDSSDSSSSSNHSDSSSDSDSDDALLLM